MQRLRLAFKRCSGVSGFMPQPVFAREVLGDGVPSKVAEVRKVRHQLNSFGLSLCFVSLIPVNTLLCLAANLHSIRWHE